MKRNSSIEAPHMKRTSPTLSWKSSLCKMENVFLIFWLVVASFAAIISPPGTGMDEATHIARAAQVAQGAFLPQEVDIAKVDTRFVMPTEEYSHEKIYGGSTDAALFELLRTGSAITDQRNKDISSVNLAFPYWKDGCFVNIGTLGNGEVIWSFPNTSINSPLCYIPYSIGYLIARLVSTSPIFAVILMRLLGIISYGLLVRFAIKKAPFCKNTLFFLALLPNCIAVSSMVNADMLTIAFTFLFFSYALRFLFYYSELRRKDFVGLGISLCALALLKMPYIIFGLVLFLVFAVNRLWENRNEMMKIASIGFVALALFLAWSCTIRGIHTYTVWNVSGVDPSAQLAYALNNPLQILSLIIDNIVSNTDLGLFEATAYCTKNYPEWLILIAAVCIISIDVHNCPKFRLKYPVVVFFLCIAVLVALTANFALYLTYTPVGDSQIGGMQSRYYVPLLIPLFIALVLACSNNKMSLLGKPSTALPRQDALADPQRAANRHRVVVDPQHTAAIDTRRVVADSSQQAEATASTEGMISAPVAVILVFWFVFALRIFSVWLPY